MSSITQVLDRPESQRPGRSPFLSRSESYSRGAINAIINTSGVAEQGTGYIRYNNGLQICWGYIQTWEYSHNTEAWYAGYITEVTVNASFPKSFLSAPIFVCSQGNYNTAHIMCDFIVSSTTIQKLSLWRPDSSYYNPKVSYIAIGMWK